MRFFPRLRKAFRYALNPGGATNKSRLSKAEAKARKDATTERLRRELAQSDTVERIAYMAVSEALEVGRVGT